MLLAMMMVARCSQKGHSEESLAYLRQYRDLVLLKSSIGSSFVSWYYRMSPAMIEWLKTRPASRATVRSFSKSVASVLAALRTLDPSYGLAGAVTIGLPVLITGSVLCLCARPMLGSRRSTLYAA